VLTGGAVKLVAVAASRTLGDSFVLDVIGTAGTLGLLIGLGYFIARLVGLAKRRLLWRVRRKLVLSYIFVGLVPALLIVIFFLLCALLLFGSVSQYVIDTRLKAAVEQAQFLARATALELGHTGSDEAAQAYLTSKQAVLAERYPQASLAVMPVGRHCELAGPQPPLGRLQPARMLSAGPWPHLEPPADLPAWVPCSGFAGLVAYTVDTGPSAEPTRGDRRPANRSTYLAVRAASLADGASPQFAVVLDLPLNEQSVRRLHEDTGIELRGIAANSPAPAKARAGARPIQLASSDAPSRLEPPWVVYTEFADWATGRRGTATLAIGMGIGDIYNRLTPRAVLGMDPLVVIVVVVGVLFLIIQFMALVVGFALAQSITGSVHQLFIGTERVQQGDFSHRIEVTARDQLGELADSFNTMTSRLTGLLAQMAEKKRLEEELRIARSIQMSLLPQGQVEMPGLQMAAHCSPAREVGGDYYDFLPLDEHRIGILIADVSGKGTSAALYMAELKGLMLSLCEIHRSPRELLVAANRIIAANIDSRSFITMTYAIVDLEAKTMIYARAGHTPLIHLPFGGARRTARILTEGGMVLGLNFDKGEKFAELLNEVTLPLDEGDLFVLFTDGISEATNDQEDLFGEERLAEMVAEHADLPLEELRERVLREVRAFAGEPGPHDDLTLILLRVQDVATPMLARPAATMAVV
jgi:phosphoserine phosphatase RsbU/P